MKRPLALHVGVPGTTIHGIAVLPFGSISLPMMPTEFLVFAFAVMSRQYIKQLVEEERLQAYEEN